MGEVAKFQRGQNGGLMIRTSVSQVAEVFGVSGGIMPKNMTTYSEPRKRNLLPVVRIYLFTDRG